MLDLNILLLNKQIKHFFQVKSKINTNFGEGTTLINPGIVKQSAISLLRHSLFLNGYSLNYLKASNKKNKRTHCLKTSINYGSLWVSKPLRAIYLQYSQFLHGSLHYFYYLLKQKFFFFITAELIEDHKVIKGKFFAVLNHLIKQHKKFFFTFLKKTRVFL